MNISIRKLAKLARIELQEEEVDGLQKDLEKILDYVEKINELEIDHVEPLSHVLELENVFREDVVIDQPQIAQDVLEALPENAKVKSYFKVPKIIESIE